MELLFIVLGGAIIGLIARYTIPERHRHGAVLVPALGAAVAAVVWEGLTWAGWKWDGGWIWWATLIVTAVVAFGAAIALGLTRRRSDAHLLATLSKSGTHR
jgi:hypothetical protein